MAQTDGIEQQILERLDILIRLLGHQVAMGHETLETKALTLSTAGLTPAEIAKICGTTPGTVSVRLTEAKRKGQRKTKKKTTKKKR